MERGRGKEKGDDTLLPTPLPGIVVPLRYCSSERITHKPFLRAVSTLTAFFSSTIYNASSYVFFFYLSWFVQPLLSHQRKWYNLYIVENRVFEFCALLPQTNR